jgi:hypothetical protein
VTPAQLAMLSADERAKVDAAMAATQGDWQPGEFEEYVGNGRTQQRKIVTCGRTGICHFPSVKDARHIVASQPSAVLTWAESLVDARIEAARMREALETVRADLELGAAAVDKGTIRAKGVREMTPKNELKVGDGVDVRITRLLSCGIRDGFTTRDEWIPGSVSSIGDDTVTIFVHEQCARRVYPIDSSDWRPADDRAE